MLPDLNPLVRPRRLRVNPVMRAMVAETTVEPRQLILPVFVAEGLSQPRPISSMPGVVQHTLESVRTIAAENAGRGITANAVLPGMVATEAVLAMPDDVRERVLAALPSGRFVEPAEVAAAVAFLASPAAGSITGEELGIDGGLRLNALSLARDRRPA